MRKFVTAAVAAVFAASMASAVFANDVAVRTSIGSGEITFTETSEKADISARELTERVKKSLKEAGELDVLNAFMDVEADVSLKFDEENQMGLTASFIGTMNKNGDDGYANFFYSLGGFGDSQSGNYTAYHWVKDGEHYTAVSDGDGWTVEKEDVMTQALEQMSVYMDSEQLDQVWLEGVQPNLYKDENGKLYYVCLSDLGTLMNIAASIDGFDSYSALIASIIGDNEVKMIAVVDVESGLPHAFSLDASNAVGQFPAELFGGEGAFEFGSGDLFITLLADTDAQEIEVPEEVLNTPVKEEDSFDLNLNEVLSAAGLLGAETEG